MRRLGMLDWRLRPRVVVAVAVQALTLVLALVGFSVWPLIVGAAIPWLLVMARRFGARSAFAAIVLGSGWLLLSVLVGVATVRLPLLGTVVVLWLVIGFAGSVALGDRRIVVRMPRLGAALWIPALLGPFVWSAALFASFFVRGAAHFAWVMTGDSANNVLFARAVIAHGGVAIGGGNNPVPLPAALLALSMSPGREATPPAHLLEHDVLAFVVVWSILIAATCYLAGIAAATVIRQGRPWIVATTGAAVSLLPLTWYVTGYPMEFGFFNMDIALPIVFACWIVTLNGRRSPVLVLVCLLITSTLLLAVWSPLVLIPVALGCVVVFSRWRRLIRVRGLRLGILALAVLQLVVYAILVVLPGIATQGAALSGGGGIYPFSKTIIAATFVVGGVTFAIAMGMHVRTAAWVLFGIFAGGGIGLAVLLFISRSSKPTPWTYYPVKLAWIITVVGMVTVAGVLAALVARGIRNRVVAMVALAIVAAGIVFVVSWAPTRVPSYHGLNAVSRVISPEATSGGDRVAERIFALTDPQHPSILWNSNDIAEATINFWILQIRANSVATNSPLRVLAYDYNAAHVSDLCSIVRLMGGTVTVDTADAGLRAKLQHSCPTIAPRAHVKVTS